MVSIFKHTPIGVAGLDKYWILFSRFWYIIKIFGMGDQVVFIIFYVRVSTDL